MSAPYLLTQEHDGCDRCELLIVAAKGEGWVDIKRRPTGESILRITFTEDEASPWLPRALRRAIKHAKAGPPDA